MITTARTITRLCGATLLAGAVGALGASAATRGPSSGAPAAARPAAATRAVTLGVTLTASPALAGGPTTLTLRVGPDADGPGRVTVTDALPRGVVYVAGSARLVTGHRRAPDGPRTLAGPDGTLLVWRGVPLTTVRTTLAVTVRADTPATLRGGSVWSDRADVYRATGAGVAWAHVAAGTAAAPTPLGRAHLGVTVVVAAAVEAPAPVPGARLALRRAAAGNATVSEELTVRASDAGGSGPTTVHLYLPPGITWAACRSRVCRDASFGHPTVELPAAATGPRRAASGTRPVRFHEVSWMLPALPAGAARTVAYRLRVAAPVPTGDLVVVTAAPTRTERARAWTGTTAESLHLWTPPGAVLPALAAAPSVVAQSDVTALAQRLAATLPHVADAPAIPTAPAAGLGTVLPASGRDPFASNPNANLPPGAPKVPTGATTTAKPATGAKKTSSTSTTTARATGSATSLAYTGADLEITLEAGAGLIGVGLLLAAGGTRGVRRTPLVLAGATPVGPAPRPVAAPLPVRPRTAPRPPAAHRRGERPGRRGVPAEPGRRPAHLRRS